MSVCSKVLLPDSSSAHSDSYAERKLLDKQKKGKARGKQFGKVEIPQEAFIGVLKINKDQ